MTAAEIILALKPHVPAVLLACCATQRYRHSMDRLWVETFRGTEYVVATDGKICARIEKRHLAVAIPPLEPGETVPSVSFDLADLWDGTYGVRPIQLPEVRDEPAAAKCVQCKGTGRFCGECWDCDGTGVIDPPDEAVRVDPVSGYMLGESLIRRMRLAGVGEVLLPLRGSEVWLGRPAKFVDGHLQGLVMPRSYS